MLPTFFFVLTILVKCKKKKKKKKSMFKKWGNMAKIKWSEIHLMAKMGWFSNNPDRYLGY